MINPIILALLSRLLPSDDFEIEPLLRSWNDLVICVAEIVAIRGEVLLDPPCNPSGGPG